MNKCTRISACLLALLLSAMGSSDWANAQQKDKNQLYDEKLYEGLSFRNVGPYRGGRSTAVTAVPNKDGSNITFFMGTTGGGVWKSDDYGHYWHNLTDGQFDVSSIGAVDAAPSSPNIIYAGTGSACLRGNVSAGKGIYKSFDSGENWEFIGLPDVGQIGDVVVHPQDPNLVYVAALGHAFGKNKERGVYRSKDGGESWEQIFFLSDSTGAVSLAMNPSNPREIYVGMWRAERKPWTMISGAEEGGVYKTIDGGENWNKLSGGLPTGVVGKVGVTVSPANPKRVWAIIEAEPAGGVYRSDDAGKSWKRINKENKLRQRAWYYTHIVADPKDENTVYVLNTGMYRSVDGGKTYEGISVPHGDVHDLWIHPEKTNIMVVADDGGAQVTSNGGKTWSTYYNQPTAELYGVVVDNGFPYRLYGAQQDNSTISVPAWSSNNTVHAKEHWYSVGGCETGPVALHPDNPDVIYSGCYGGVIDRYDHKTKQVRNMIEYPQLQLGEAAKNLEYRFQWVSPIVVSPHDENVVFHGSQYVSKTTDGGKTWEKISPDLTTNNPAHQQYAGGPINHDMTGVEIYNTLFAITVSPHDANEIWTGSDDGRVHLTRDEGKTWTDITPKDLPELATVENIDVSVHDKGTAYLAAQRYRLDDFEPYIYKTENYGRSWKLISGPKSGFPEKHPVREVKEDPEKEGLLFAGTEFGLFVSFNGGDNWQEFQLDLPVTPVSGIQVAHGDLILSTQGRSFWILDDMTPLRELNSRVANESSYLFKPRDAYRVNDMGPGGEYAPASKPHGATIHYYTKEADEVTLEVLDDQNRIVHTFTMDSTLAKKPGTTLIKPKAGMQRLVWDLTYPGPDMVEGAVVWGFTGGIKAPPGTYRVRMQNGRESITQSFEVLNDPRLTDVTKEDYIVQFEFSQQVRDSINQIQNVLRDIESIKEQLAWIADRAKDSGMDPSIQKMGEELQAKLSNYQQKLHQTKNESGQDPIRFPPRIDNQFLELYKFATGPDGYISGGAEGRPVEAAYKRTTDLNAAWIILRKEYERLINVDVAAFNQAVEGGSIRALTKPNRDY